MTETTAKATDESPKIKGTSTLSKKKYEEFSTGLSQLFANEPYHVDKVLELLRITMHFDPNVSTYNEAQLQRIKARRERLKAEGVSTYVSSGTKACYYRRKEASSTAA